VWLVPAAANAAVSACGAVLHSEPLFLGAVMNRDFAARAAASLIAVRSDALRDRSLDSQPFEQPFRTFDQGQPSV
jgi:hypothetical protein